MKRKNCTWYSVIVVIALVLNICNCFEFQIGAVHFKNGVHIIHEGTKWCGNGNIAENDDDLGEFRQLDSCCRSHDKCFMNIPSRGTKNGLTNELPFTVSHCNCDLAFYKCLKTVKDSPEEKFQADDVGADYFNTLNMPCFNFSHPATCVSEERRSYQVAMIPMISMMGKRCTSYEFNTRARKKWQFFEVPFY